MQIDHPADRLFVVSCAKDVFRCSRTDLLQTALLFLNLHLDLINLIVAPLVLESENFSVLFTNALPKLISFVLTILVVLVVGLILPSLHFHETLDKRACPELGTRS